jgi:hypothetical protein
MTFVALDAEQYALMVSTNERGQRLSPGDEIGEWPKGEFPYGMAKACPFCRAEQYYTAFWYNGPGSPPSYAWHCGNCGAQGPTSAGLCRGDHYGAMLNAVEKWNAGRVVMAADRAG